MTFVSHPLLHNVVTHDCLIEIYGSLPSTFCKTTSWHQRHIAHHRTSLTEFGAVKNSDPRSLQTRPTEIKQQKNLNIRRRIGFWKMAVCILSSQKQLLIIEALEIPESYMFLQGESEAGKHRTKGEQ